MDRAIHSRCRIEAMTEVRFFLILFPIKPYVRRNIEKEQKKAVSMVHTSAAGGTQMNEAALIQKIRKYLATVPECFFWKEHGGQYGTAGIPDIIVCHKGRFIALEAKVGRNTPTKLQAATIDQIRKAGGTAVVVYSVEDVQAVISKKEALYDG